MKHKHVAVAALLMDIEKELRQLQLWDNETPSPEALASSQPFAIDTLNFPQWLQFIFIPKLYFLIEHQAALPSTSGVAPMAEQYFQVLPLASASLIGYLQKIDTLISEP